MATFQVSFTAAETSDGLSIIITDTTNYGVTPGVNDKADFKDRTLTVIRSDNTGNSTLYDFPFTNTDNAIQDTFTFPITYDYCYTFTLTLIPITGAPVGATNPVISTTLLQLNLTAILLKIGAWPGDPDVLTLDCFRVYAKLMAAVQRASTGDIAGAGSLLGAAYDIEQNYVTV